MDEISEQMSSIDLEGCDFSIEEALCMVEFLQSQIQIVKNKLLDSGFKDEQEEICFFKEMKPHVLTCAPKVGQLIKY